MRITKKIISLFLVVAMLASFLAMSGFEASANIMGQTKTDFGIHFDDTTRKLKVLQLPDIQSSVSEGGGDMTQRTKDTIRLLMQRYNPDIILLTGDQTQGGSSSSLNKWKSTLDTVFNTFAPYMKSTCKVIAMPGNHEYDFGSLKDQWSYYNSHSYVVDWDNNFSTVDLNGEPGAGNVTVSASSTNKAVALNLAIFNSKGDDDDGYLRPGGDDNSAYQQIVNWYTATNNTLASSQYSYKAQVTGQSSAYVPAFAAQHVILQEIFTTGAITQGDSTNGIAMLSKYSYLNSNAYIRLDPANNPSGAMNEVPCPSTLGAGSTAALYNALLSPGNLLGMTFGHDHDNYFDVVDDNGFHFYMGGALTQENYNTDENPKARYFEFTLDDATGDVNVTSEVKSYTQLSVTSNADVSSNRTEAINGEGKQMVHTISAPKVVYIGASENLSDVRAKQEFGNVVQTQMLDYKTKQPYDQDLAVNFCLPSGATNVVFTAKRSSNNQNATMTNLGTETTTEGTLYKYAITGGSTLTKDEHITYTVTYTYGGVAYEIRNVTMVESIKQPAGYQDWFRGYRESNNSKHFVDLAYVGTLSGANAYSVARDTSTNSGDLYVNTYYNYSLMIADVDQTWINKAGQTEFSMVRYSPSRREVTDGLVSQRAIYSSAQTDIYLDASAMPKVSATDSRLDTGVSIDFWIQKDLDRGFTEYIAGIGFYDGDQDFVPSGATVDPNDPYSSYNEAVTAENGSTGSGGTIDEATIFLYDSYARQQSYLGVGTTHVNGNRLPENLLGNTAGQYKGYPLVVDNKQAVLDLNGEDMTMFTGVRNKGSSDGGYRILLYDVAPYYLMFHTYDKGDLRDLTMAELMNPRKRSDYPNATDEMWAAYLTAYQTALNCYAQYKTTQNEVNSTNTALQAAISALLNSNKGIPDSSLLLQGTSSFASIDVPPIIYVDGSSIVTASPFNDLTIKFSVPSNAQNVSCTVVNAGNDNVNTAVKTTTTNNGTAYTTTITEGTATKGGSIYYKFSYTLPQDKNKDGKNDTYTQYAASYVKDKPNTEGKWITMTRNKGGWMGDRNTRIHYDSTMKFANNVFTSRGVSGIMALYGNVQGTSFDTRTVNNQAGDYTGHPDGADSIWWAVGTAQQWPNSNSGSAAAGRVLFKSDRPAQELDKNGYHDGLYAGSKSQSSTRSNEYIVAHIYFDPQATGATVKPQITLTLSGVSGGDEPHVRRYWDTNNYSGVNYGGRYSENAPTNSGMWTAVSNNWPHNNGNLIEELGNSASYTTVIEASKALNEFQTSYSRMVIQAERGGGNSVYNWSTTAFAFVFNRVDKSKAHDIINKVSTNTAWQFNQDEMDPEWWSQWRTEVLKAYSNVGNLWAQADFNPDLINSLQTNPVYEDADYSVLVSTLNQITGNVLVNECIPNANYDALTFAISSGDDQRYAGTRYSRDMFVNNATELINIIKNRVTVYSEVDSGNRSANDAAGNLVDAHLDVRFQKYINDYATALQQAWNNLRLAPADYTNFNKYSNYYNSTNDTILFMRDDYAGYHNDGNAKNYANEKALASGIYTYSTYTAFVNSLNIDRTLKKPSETAAIGTLPRLYPKNYTYLNVTSPDVPDTTNCLYNTARNAYEGLEFRRAGEYYSSTGSYTEGGVTYYADYNMSDRGSSYVYTPVFRTSYNSLAADITNGGYVVTDNKVKVTYNNGNNGDIDKDNEPDDNEIWVLAGDGTPVNAINPWTDASWGGANYGFKNAYEDHIKNATSTYQSTNSSANWILALFVEAEILPDIASVDYYYDKLVPGTYDLTQYNNQKNTLALYELNGDNYGAVMALLANSGYVPCDAQGNEITGGAAWYEATSWNEYQTSKDILPNIIDNATLKENQDAINYAASVIYQKRAALKHKAVTEFTVKDSEGNIKTFASILADMNADLAEIQSVQVDVFGLRGNEDNVITPKTYAEATQNGASQGPLFVKHNYYNDNYVNALSSKITVVNSFAEKDAEGKDKALATYLEQYLAAVNDFTTLYNDSANPSYVNKANTYYLEILLNKDWIPPYDKYGAQNAKPTGGWFLGEEFDGSSWYTEESWERYVEARNHAVSFFGAPGATQGATSFDDKKVYDGTSYYGGTNQPLLGQYTVLNQGAKFSIDLDPTSPTYGQPIAEDGSNLTGSVNKATYDLVVAYYQLQYKKVSDFDGVISGIDATGYDEINTRLNEMITAKENEWVEVVIIDENGNLATVRKSIYGDAEIARIRTLAAEVTKLANENLGPNYLDYVDAVNECKKAIDKLTPVPVYLDGWNGILNHLNENAGDIMTINSDATMALYFNAVYSDFSPSTTYAVGGMCITNIFSNKAMYDSFGLTAKQGQTQYNVLVTNLYNELKAASLTPKQVTSARDEAMEKLMQGAKPAYDPIQLNGRTKVQALSVYTPASVNVANVLVASVGNTKVTLWDTNPTATGYNDAAGTVIDGSIADEIWAAVGLVSDSGAKDYDGADRDNRYLLVEGGQFVDALNDAIAYAMGELYEEDGVTVKQFDVVTGEGEVIPETIFTDESVNDLVRALAAAVVTETTTQDQIDQWVFNILENTDIDNKIFLLAEDGTFYGTLNDEAEDEGLKYKPAKYDYLDIELGTAFSADGEGAQVIIDMVWLDNGDGTFTLDNTNGSKYFTAYEWTAYYTNYINALNPNIISRDLTAKDQDKINAYTTAIYDSRNALAWNGIDDNTWSQIDELARKIGSLESETFTVYTFVNSKVQVLDDGTRVLTAPDIVEKEVSAYGDVSQILSLWNTFNSKYLEQELDITKQAEMLEKLQEIKNMYESLETKRFDTSTNNEFTEGVRNLVDSFIAGTYTFNGFSSGGSIGTYVPDYQAVDQGTNVSVTEQNVRNEQYIYIQSKLNALYTIIGSGMEAGDVYIDNASGVRYDRAMEAVNAIAMELYEYLTTTPAQYAGFGLDMRQDMYDFLSTEITIAVDYRYAATNPVYTKTVPMFRPDALDTVVQVLEGTGMDGDYGVFGDVANWPMISQLDSSVGIEFTEDTAMEQLTFQQPIYDEETGEIVGYEEVYVNSGVLSFVNGYSYLYGDAVGAVYEHDIVALDWILNNAIAYEGEATYFLADTNGPVDINGDGVLFHYTMDSAVTRDGEWYNSGYGTDIAQNGTSYYLAADPANTVTGSEYGGWFTNATYDAVIKQMGDSAAYLEYASYSFGSGPIAVPVRETIENEPTEYGICWNTENRTAYLNAVQADQSEVDGAAAAMYGKLCSLELLPATDAYRYVAGLIYDALGLVPQYKAENFSDIIIKEGVGKLVEHKDADGNKLGGYLYNFSLMDDLTTCTVIRDENGEIIACYSLQLPDNYYDAKNGKRGEEAVYAILDMLQDKINKGVVTIDQADALVLADENSVKSEILTALKSLGLGKADLSLITSLVAAFLYNSPGNENALGSYDIGDNGAGTEFFNTHRTLGTGGFAAQYKGNQLMQQAGDKYHESGFYDYTNYKDESIQAVIEFLDTKNIVSDRIFAQASDYVVSGFNIVFNPETDARARGELYDTPATQQEMINGIYRELVTLINALELRDATTGPLKEQIVAADDIMLNEEIYDHEAVNTGGKNIWKEFADAHEEAQNFVNATVINEDQVAQAAERLQYAIRDLVLYVDTFAPVVTIHNTQTDLSKFYAEHADELSYTIPSASQMVTASYMEPGLGGYTLYVYTNQLNPHIVVSLKDTTNVLNGDGSARTVSASKPEKLSVSAQAMGGVSASVITPVFDATTGMPLSSVSTELKGATTVTTQTAKNSKGTYDSDSYAYIILNPQFSDIDGKQQAAAYTIGATDSAMSKDKDTQEFTEVPNGVESFNYANNPELIETTAEGKVTVFIYYMNSMPADGSDSGLTADGAPNGTSVLTYAENEGRADDEWASRYGLLRMFNGAIRNWEFSDINKDLNEDAVYIDPTFGENNFGSFIYKLDPTATKGLDYDISKIYFEQGPDAAKDAFIRALNSNNDYIAAFDAESQNPASTKYIPYGAGENWDQHLAFIDNGTLLFVHVADRFGNVCNRIIEVENYDQLAPELTAVDKGAVSVVEPGGSGVAKVDLFKYMGTQGSSLYIDCLFDMLHIEDFTYVSEDNTFTIKAGAESAGKFFTVAVTDNAGNVGSVPVYADENGDIVVTVVETFENVAEYTAKPKTDDGVTSGEDKAIEFKFNSNQTIILNYSEPSSIVKAGPDGNVFANKKNVPLNITTKSEVEAIKLYNVGTGAEEIWTVDNATVTDNGDGTKTWTVKYKFTEGEHSYIATAKVNGDWETFGVDFSFTATTKSVMVKLMVSGIGKIRFGYNEGNYSNVPVMSQKTVPYGSVVTLEAVQIEEGSDFYYWINNSSNRIISASETYEFTAVTNMDLTTQFTTNECFTNDKRLVVYVNNAENVIENFELSEGEDYAVPAAPSLPDHVFERWSMTKEEILASDEMMIVVRPVYSLVVKNTVTLTEGNWTTTGAGVYESVGNERAVVTVSASAEDGAGASFLYWLDAETGDIASYSRTYSFHAIKDTELTPVYGDASAVIPAPVARISTIKYDSSAKKVNFYAERSIPAEYELIQTGIIVTKTASVGNDAQAFILDAAGVGKGVSKSTAANGFYTGAVAATAGTTVYARAYVIYMNADGDIITSYSPISSYTV